MEPIQVIGILFALFAYSRSIIRFKDNKITVKEFIFWTIIWVSVIIVSIVPGITAWISNLTGVRRPVDFLVYASIIILFYLIFRMYIKIDEINQNITKVVRHVAKEKGKEQKKK